MVDPAYAPGTGTQEPGGVSSFKILNAIRLLKGQQIVGMDLVEVSPPYDHAGITAALGAKIVREAILSGNSFQSSRFASRLLSKQHCISYFKKRLHSNVWGYQSVEQKAELKRSLKLWHVFALGLAFLAPIGVFDTYGIATEITNGHVPASYLVTMAAILFTASSYSKMAQAFPRSGSAYTYTQQVLSPNLGFLVGWSALCDYLFFPMVNALVISLFMSAVFPEIPSWVWIVGLILVITLANIFSLKVTVTFNSIIVFLQLVVIVIFVVLLIRTFLHGEGTTQLFSLRPFYSPDLTWSVLLAGSSLLAYSFLGFDAITTLSEETIDPQKTIPRAIFLIALYAGLSAIIVTYIMQSAFPEVTIFNNLDGASVEIAEKIGGVFFQSLFLGVAVVSSIASGIASQISASRLLYAMGRDNVLPRKIFGYIHPRTGVPVYNILLTGIVALTALFLDLLTTSSFINFGAFTAFTFTNLSVIVYYAKRENLRTPKTILNYFLSPLIGMGFILFLWTNLNIHALILGLMWNAVGFVYLLYLTKGFRQKPPQFIFEESA